MMKHNSGFTLIELLIAVTIVGLLGAVAYPSYTSMMQKSNRADAIDELLSLERRMIEYYNVNDTYVGATVLVPTSSDGYYTLSISKATIYEYELTATPLGWTDTKCGNMIDSSLGEKKTSVGGTAKCW